jgi:hypothetical protein
MHVAIEAELNDGGRVVATCRGPKGSWGVPLAPSDHREKLVDCFSRALPQAQVDDVIGRFERLDSLDARSVQQLIAQLATSTHR